MRPICFRHAKTASAALALLPFALLLSSPARADSVAQLQVYKRLTRETIALIDPQGGTSAGGASSNVKYAIGDILTFRIAFTPVPNNATRGLGGYITEYVPANTEVVGARLVDRFGMTVPPHRGGYGSIGWGPRGAGGYKAPLTEGGMSSLYADTGVFYSTDPRTARVPADAFPTVSNGIFMNPSPTGAGQLDEYVGVTNGQYYAHNLWDWIQVRAFGVGGGALGAGTGNTPFGYGSAVAGPDTFYQFEATETAPGVIEAKSLAGPWKRILTPGAEIGTGVPATQTGPYADRLGIPTSTGWVLSATNPLPPNTNAVRYAVGELVVGDEYFAEISLRVKASPLDPVMNDDVNCAEVFGGDASGRNQAGTDGGKDNAWRYFLPSASCMKLDLRFELDVDKVMAVPGDSLTYTITTQNLALQPRTNVVIKHDLSTTGGAALVSATGNPTVAGDVLTWAPVTLAPGEKVIHTIVTKANGGDSTTSVATYTSDQLPAPGFTVQTLSTISPIANLDLALDVAPSVVMPGSTVTYTATVKNVGTGVANGAGCAAPGCMAIVKLPPGFSYVAGTAKVNGAAAPNPTVGADLRFAPLPNVAPGATLSLTFDATVDAGAAAGAYDAMLETWFKDPGAGRDIEDAVFGRAKIHVGVTPSDAPAVSGPIVAGATKVCGTTTEADGTTITVYVDLLPVGTATSSAGKWCVTVPALYAGQDVTATAKNAAAGEAESAPSAPVREVETIGGVGPCNDGLDNDGDGLVDAADPGCTSATDPDETDPTACSDGLDNDGDGKVDFPEDTSCSSYADNDEAGPPACSDGVDNDGDGQVDFPGDKGCSSADDVSEADLPVCANGLDDDGDGKADYPADPGCAGPFDDNEKDEVGAGSSGGSGGTGASGGAIVGPAGVGGGGVDENGSPPDRGGVPDGSNGGSSGDEGGCGCRTATSSLPAPSSWAMVAVACALAFRRRHGRPRRIAGA